MNRFFQQLRIALRRLRYPGDGTYWERRYAKGGNSGSGSSGILAAYKANTVNRFVEEQGILSILELGCGDGQQLRLARYPAYTGLDIAPSAIEQCRRIFAADPSKTFQTYDSDRFNPTDFQADMALSMEVIFHLTDEYEYRTYLNHLFACAQKWVVIFSSDEQDKTGGIFPHFKPRYFTPDVPAGWKLRQRRSNPHRDISISDFFFFEKVNGNGSG